MFKSVGAFSGFSVKDLAETKKFYSEILGLKVEQDEMGLKLNLPNGTEIFVYQKDNHEPATFTILNFVVENIDEAMEHLLEKGVEFEMYEGMYQDEKGITRGLSNNMGPDIAWFKDPSGNILSILQDK